jgi:hypothetical protein
MSDTFNLSWIGARLIMGRNFFGVEESITHLGVKPSMDQLLSLAKIPFSQKTLRKCRDTHVLVAVFPISILEIGTLKNIKFRNLIQARRGSLPPDQPFMNYEGKARWELVRKAPISWSINRNWNGQKALLWGDDEIPNAQTLVYSALGHYLTSRGRMFENVLVRCSDKDERKLVVFVGFSDFYEGGKSIAIGSNYHFAGFNNQIGLATAKQKLIG